MSDLDSQPVVFAYDGSGPARAAIAHAGRIQRFTRGRSGAVAAMLGSTAEGILRHAHRSVLVVRDD